MEKRDIRASDGGTGFDQSGSRSLFSGTDPAQWQLAHHAIGRYQMLKDSTHVEGTVQALARLREEHERKATLLQRIVGGFTGRAASPGFVILLTAILLAWIGVNSAKSLSMNRPSSGCRAPSPWLPCT
jgi:hypothetical protein